MGPFQIYFEVLNLRQEKKIEILWTITIITNCNKVAITSLKNTIKSAIIKEKRNIKTNRNWRA